MRSPLLAELDELGVTLGGDDGAPYLRVPGGIDPHRRAALLAAVAGNRAAVLAHLRRPAEPAPEPTAWECVACGREVTAELIPLLDGPHYCDRGGVSPKARRVTTGDGVVMEAAERCPFKTSGG